MHTYVNQKYTFGTIFVKIDFAANIKKATSKNHCSGDPKIDILNDNYIFYTTVLNKICEKVKIRIEFALYLDRKSGNGPLGIDKRVRLTVPDAQYI